MSRPCIVLKFGGSVLGSAADLPRVVSEIYRWRREGCAVVAVVSAFHGTTDRLFAEARSAVDDADPHAIAEHVARGEHESATRLAFALDRSGVAAAVLTPAVLEATYGARMEVLEHAGMPVVVDAVRQVEPVRAAGRA